MLLPPIASAADTLLPMSNESEPARLLHTVRIPNRDICRNSNRGPSSGATRDNCQPSNIAPIQKITPLCCQAFDGHVAHNKGRQMPGRNLGSQLRVWLPRLGYGLLGNNFQQAKLHNYLPK